MSLHAAPDTTWYGLSRSCSSSFQVGGSVFSDCGPTSGSKNSSCVRRFVEPLQMTLPPGQVTPEALPNSPGGPGFCAFGVATVSATAKYTHAPAHNLLLGD